MVNVYRNATLLPQDFEFVFSSSERHPKSVTGIVTLFAQWASEGPRVKVRPLRVAHRVLKPDGTLWVTGALHHLERRLRPPELRLPQHKVAPHQKGRVPWFTSAPSREVLGNEL